jgi:hypothetical protein
MGFHKRLVPFLVVVGFVGLITSPRAAFKELQDSSTWTVIGRKVAWTMQAPSGWIGGSHTQIQQVLDTTNNANIKKMLGEIWYTARQIDAYLVHTDVSNVASRTPSSITIDLVEKGFDAKDFNNDMWRAFAATGSNRGNGATTEFVESDTLKVGGRTAPRGMFKTTLPSGAIIYKIDCVVLLDAQRSHMFTLEADGAKVLARVKDFDEMLYTVRYK